MTNSEARKRMSEHERRHLPWRPLVASDAGRRACVQHPAGARHEGTILAVYDEGDDAGLVRVRQDDGVTGLWPQGRITLVREEAADPVLVAELETLIADAEQRGREDGSAAWAARLAEAWAEGWRARADGEFFERNPYRDGLASATRAHSGAESRSGGDCGALAGVSGDGDGVEER